MLSIMMNTASEIVRAVSSRPDASVICYPGVFNIYSPIQKIENKNGREKKHTTGTMNSSLTTVRRKIHPNTAAAFSATLFQWILYE